MSAFKLNKHEIAQATDLIATARQTGAALSDAIAAFNAAMEDLSHPIRDALQAHNDARQELRQFAEDVAMQAETDMDGKSERWLESERGEQAQSFKDWWEEMARIDDCELDLPEPLDEIDPSEELPEEIAASLDEVP
jgi:hypothetical protein